MSFAILNAVRNNDPKTLESLLKDKTLDINASEQDGIAPILWASYQKDSKCMELLIKAGADLEQQDEQNYTALIIATMHNNLDSLNLLIKAGANVKYRSYAGMTPLIKASAQGNYRCVQILIDAGADIEEIDVNEWTALSHAVQNRTDTNSTHALIKAGANIETRDYAGRTTIFLATNANSIKNVEYLISVGANTNAIDEKKNTVLETANKNFHNNPRPQTADIINILEAEKEKQLQKEIKAKELKQEFEKIKLKKEQIKQRQNIRRFIRSSTHRK